MPLRRRAVVHAGACLVVGAVAPARAHHGWSGFDQNRPIYLEGRVVEVRWRNPHAELVLEPPRNLRLPSDLATRTVPAQTAAVDGPGLLSRASLPTRRDARWEVELAPLSRVAAWGLPQPDVGDEVAVLGFTFREERGAALLRAEYVWVGGKAYAMRSSPA